MSWGAGAAVVVMTVMLTPSVAPPVVASVAATAPWSLAACAVGLPVATPNVAPWPGASPATTTNKMTSPLAMMQCGAIGMVATALDSAGACKCPPVRPEKDLEWQHTQEVRWGGGTLGGG